MIGMDVIGVGEHHNHMIQQWQQRMGQHDQHYGHHIPLADQQHSPNNGSADGFGYQTPSDGKPFRHIHYRAYIEILTF